MRGNGGKKKKKREESNSGEVRKGMLIVTEGREEVHLSQRGVLMTELK